MENPYFIAVEHTFLLYRSRVHLAEITEPQKKELIEILDQCEKLRPKKLSNIKKLGKYEDSLKHLNSKFEEYAGSEAMADICKEIDDIYNTCSSGVNIDNIKEKLAAVINGGKKCLN